MTCDYCFYCDEAKKRTQHVYGMMNEKTLETIIEKTISEADAVASFTWQGGEPTLRGIDFFEKAAALQRKYKQQYQRNNLHIMNSFQTNGYELDRQWAKFFKRNQFLVGLSIDGLPEIHDSFRKGKDGSESFFRVKQAAELGYQFDVGPECEFFLYHTDDNGQPTTITHERAGYFDLGPMDLGENARRDMVLTLEDMGFEIEASHHEMAPAQHEIDFRYDEALTTADNIMTFKLAVKTIAKRHGLHASFMPKPKTGINGSGMHINMSLSKDGKNIFADDCDPNGLSQEAYYFIGGLMRHVKGMCAITNPLVNSYKRLVPGFEAPVYIAWSGTNRSPLIRIPAERGEGTRIELRCPDPSANPYLVLAVCLAAGLDGIQKQIMPPAAVDRNIFNMTEEEILEEGIDVLPNNLLEAVYEMEKDELVKEVLGTHTSRRYIKAKKKEWAEYSRQVSGWELDQYLYRI